jgi:Uma2 family endonuclease
MSALSTDIETLADLMRELGVDADRIHLHPPLGRATEMDVVAAYHRDKRLCELVDGVLIEKVPGYCESRVATVLSYHLLSFLRVRNDGIVVGGNAFHRLKPSLVRSPSVAYLHWQRLPNRRVPRDPIPDAIPNLAVEVLRPRNTRTEMERKRREYFEAGVELVWQIDPRARTFEVFTSPDDSVVIGIDGVVDGGTVLPGFQLSVREFFDRADRGPQTTPP